MCYQKFNHLPWQKQESELFMTHFRNLGKTFLRDWIGERRSIDVIEHHSAPRNTQHDITHITL